MNLLLSFQCSAQPFRERSNPFISPVDFKILLSGNFAELRGSHFHTGIDIKTMGSTGHNIYAIDDGYVARIKVSPYGYGNALYIRHPNGFTSVYAHLKSFNIQIDRFVEKNQYAQKKFALNLYPDKYSIPVSQGDVIGKSGNSGSSRGPHLHFEIRKTSNEKPQNPLKWRFNIKDNIAPRFHHLILYPLSLDAQIEKRDYKKIYSLKQTNNRYKIPSNKTIKVSGTIGVGAYVNDYLNDTYNRCGVHQLKLFLDEQLIYHLQLDELSFAESRYILSHMDYALKVDRKIKAHKCFIEQGNHFSGYLSHKNHGKISLRPGEQKKVKIEAIDAHGNKSVLKFKLEGKESTRKKTAPTHETIIKPNMAENFEREEIQLNFPPGTFYKTVYYTYEKNSGNDNHYSDIHKLHNHHEPIHKRYNIAIKTQNVAPQYQNKLYLAQIYKNGNSASASSGINYKDGWAHTRLRHFGTFTVMVDTVSPIIKPINIYENKDMSSAKSIRIKAWDKQTGIGSYNGYINGSWVLFQYDAKNSLFYYEFDEHIPQDEKYNLKMVITDKKQNTAVKRINFQYNPNQTSLK